MNAGKHRGAWLALNAAMLLALVLALLPGAAAAQPVAQAGPPASPSGVAPDDVGQVAAGAYVCPDSSRPQSAQTVPLARDEELGVTAAGGGGDLYFRYRDYAGGALTGQPMQGWSDINNSWSQSVAADLNGDGYDELVSVYRDGGNGNQTTMRSLIWHPGIAPSVSYWYSGLSRNAGDSMYDSIAAGNMLRYNTPRQDIVIAFKNNDADLELIEMGGNANGGFYNGPGYIGGRSGQYHGGAHLVDTGDGRDNVNYVDVAVGDLNGDGWKDDIVAAFKDSASHLQIMLARWDSTGFHVVANKRYTEHSADKICNTGTFSEHPERGLSVTTGDVDSDGRDEAIVAFVDNGSWNQVVAAGLDQTGQVFDEDYYFRANHDNNQDADYVAVVAPDLNGDGVAEIIMAYSNRYSGGYGNHPVQVWRLSYDADKDKDKDGQVDPDWTGLKKDETWADQASWDAGDYTHSRYMSAVKVNPDKAARDKVLVAFTGIKSGDDIVATRLLGLKADDTGLELKAQENSDFGADVNYDVSAVAADINNDSSRLTYTGTCYEYANSTVNVVANEPPAWYDTANPTLLNSGNNGPAVRYGVTQSGSHTEGNTTAVTYGASYTVDGSVSFLDMFEMGPKFSAEFSGSHAVTDDETVDAGWTKELAASYDYNNGSMYGLVSQETVTYHTYKYVENTTGTESWVRVPVGRDPYADFMEKWNSRQQNAGWLQVGPGPRYNLALGRGNYTSQSSDYSATLGKAKLAVDGNINGDFFDGSVTHTGYDAQAWWQVDLGAAYPIEAVDVFNRQDCCVDRLSNWVVKVSDTGTDWASPKWTSPAQTGNALTPTVVPAGVTGRYVRVQLLGTNNLSLAEVQVWADARANLARGKTARQSSNYFTSGGTANLAVDGNTDGTYANGSVTHTSNTPAPVWWDVDLGSRQPIGEVDVWNRTDGAANGYVARLKNYYVKVYDADPATGASAIWTSNLQQDVAGRPSAIPVGVYGRWVRIELRDPNYLTIAEVQVFKGRQVGDYPKAISRDNDSYFTVTDQNGTTRKVSGNLKWDWCTGYKDPSMPQANLIPGSTGGPIKVGTGQAETTWNTSTSYSQSSGWEDTYGFSASFGEEAKVMGAGAEWSISAGFEKGHSVNYGWNKGTYYEGSAGTMAQGTTAYLRYSYCPYYYLTTVTSPDGVDQTYTAVDYYVPCIGYGANAQYPQIPAGAAACGWTAAPQDKPAAQAPLGPQVKPGTPVISSATHPDQNAWSDVSTAAFTWQQPTGDPSTGLIYRWYLDQTADTVPTGAGQGTDQTYTYYDLADGTWYLHVRAMATDGQWSDTAHYRIRIDTKAPDVKLVYNPALPLGNGGWYTTTVSLAANSTDTGSGVAAIETSSDGVAWAPYGGALSYTTDTPPTAVWARSRDNAGHVSSPISTTVKVDLTAPDSHASGTGCAWGVCFADIHTDAQGNEHLLLMGQIKEATAGRSGMAIQADGGSWMPASALGDWHPFPDRPEVGINWVYTSTLDLGHGYHIFNGRSIDNAGHQEEPYKIAEVIWYPLASPDLSQSVLSIEPAVARPGDQVKVKAVVRNGGRQEAHVAFTVTLPAGLTPVADSLASVDGSIKYDAGTGTITWPEVLLWPGEDWQVNFLALAGSGQAAGNLTARLDAHAFWPNTDLLPSEAMKQRFRDHEASATTNAVLAVDPQLPAGKDVTPPHVQLAILDGEIADSAQVQLQIGADAGASQMWIREWTLDPTSGAWTTARDSGWLPYASTLPWRLSEVGGVHYVGAWVADTAFNVSRLDEASLAFTNRLIPDDLLAGQLRQYRFSLEDGLAAYSLLAQSGEAGLFAWLPRSAQYPAYVGTGDATLKGVAFQVEAEGVHLVEAVANADGAYTLAAFQNDTAAALAAATLVALPNHPLTASTPLTAGAGNTPIVVVNRFFFPIFTR